MKHIALAAVAATTFLISCNRVDYYQADSYVGRYDDLTKITLVRNDGDAVCIDVKSDFDAQGCYGPGDEKYSDLCRKHGDVGYNRKIAYLSGRDVVYNASDLLSVKVYSDRDFDAEHPAGSSLADIVRFLSCSPKEYIASGYKSMYSYDAASLSEVFVTTWAYCYYWGRDAYECHPIDKMLSDITPEDLVLLGPGLRSLPQIYNGRFFSLAFVKKPSAEQVHEITVEITTEERRIITGHLNVNFDDII